MLDTETDLTTEQALAILEPYFLVVRERFVEAGYALGRIRLKCRSWMHDSPRHFAGCLEDGSEIVVAPELAELGYDTVCAIFAHELGHATDFTYPARFILQPDRHVRTVPPPDDDVAAARHWRRWLSEWKRRDEDTVELTADGIAETVMGVPIGYRGPCLLQAFGGRPRPLGLR